MEKSSSSKSQLKIARIAGLLYTLMIPLGVFGIMYVPSTIIVTGNIEGTINNILTNIGIFRLSVICALVVQICHIFIVLLLYKLLMTVNRNMALFMVIFMLVSIPITIVNELNHYAIILLVNNGGTSAHQTSYLIDLFFKLHEYGILIAGIFWGLWLFPMGYLVLKSSFLPKIIGIFLMVACCGYVIDSILKLALPSYAATIIAKLLEITMYGEILFPLWLLIRGINLKKWEENSANS